MFYKIIVVLFSISISSCKCQEQTMITQKVNKVTPDESIQFEEIYFQKWVAGIQGGGAGITVYLNLSKPLDQGVAFKKLQLKTFETGTIDKIDELHYVARINTNSNDLKLNEDPKKEYGNEMPPKSNISLKEGEAKVFFIIKGKMVFQLVEGVKEKEMLAYPSMRPENNDK